MTPLVSLAAILCFHGCFHAAFPQTRFHPPLSAAVVQPRFCRQVNRLFNNFSCADRFTFRFPHPFPRGTEFTENPMTKCVCVCVSVFPLLCAGGFDREAV